MQRDEVDEFSGLHLRGAVGRDTGRQLHPAAVDRGKHDDRCLELVLQLVHRVAQRLRVGAVEYRGEHPHALHIDRLGQQFVALRRRQPALQRREFLFECPHVFDDLRHALGHFGRRGLERAGKLVQRAFERLQVAERVDAGDGLDAPHARRHSRLGNDLEQADVAAALHMGAAAELAAGADVEHAHLVAVFLAEQHHRAELLRFFDRQHARDGGGVGKNLGVHQRLDLFDVLRRHRRAVGKVETRALGVHERALLLHVRAQHFAQRLVHQVRGAVVAHGARTVFGVDPRVQLVADRDAPLDDAAVVTEHRRLHLDRVVDQYARRGVAQFAGVAHLPARLGIERRVVEHDDGVVARLCAVDRRAVDIDRGHGGVVAREHVVAVKGGRGAAVFESRGHLELPRGARLVALAGHCRVETDAVDADAAFAADVGRQVERKAEGVVQLEGGVSVDRFLARFFK